MAKPKAKARDFSAQVEMVPIGSVRGHAKNPRIHSASQIKMLATAIRKFGFINPILVDEDGIICAGHGRHLAAEQVGLKEIPVIRITHLSATEINAFRIGDNRLASLSEWDEDLLREQLASLQVDNFDFEAIGFDNESLLAALAQPNSGLTDPDDAPPAKPDPAVRISDVWILGEHRILCGDSTKKADVARVLAGAKPRLMVTDPPYGVNYDPSWRPKAGIGSKDTARGKVMNDDRADWSEAWALFPGAVAYVWHGGLHGGVVQQSLKVGGFNLKAQIVWVKTRAALSRGNYHWQHEPAFYVARDGEDDWQGYVEEHDVAAYAVKEGQTHKWTGGRKQSTVWFIEHLKNDTGHGTQKPVECMRRPILNNSPPGAAVYDPFVGSFTTGIACEMTGRRCYAIELDPTYVVVCIERWQLFTGKTAVLESTGQTLEQVTKARRSGRPKGGVNEKGDHRDPVRRPRRSRGGVRPAVAQ